MDTQTYQRILGQMLSTHYGISINDTAFADQELCDRCIAGGIRPLTLVNEHAKKNDLRRIDIRGMFGLPSMALLTIVDEARAVQRAASTGNRSGGTDTGTTKVRSAEYAGSIIGGREDQYDALEVHGVRNLYPEGDSRGTCFEVDEENPEMFSVYAHLKEGGVDAIGDFGQYKLATQYANRLSSDYAWPIHDAVAASGCAKAHAQ